MKNLTNNTYLPLSLLDEPAAIPSVFKEEVHSTANRLIEMLNKFGISSKLLQINIGATFSRYEITLTSPIKYSTVTSLSKDIAMWLGVEEVIISPVLGKPGVISIDIPNNEIYPVCVKTLFLSNEFQYTNAAIPVTLGIDGSGNTIVVDISEIPYMVIAGTTGSGKSNLIHLMVMSILYKVSYNDLRIIMIDPLPSELTLYNGIPHLLIPVVTNDRPAADTLNWTVTETKRRLALFRTTNTNDIISYNKSSENKKLPRLLVIIDTIDNLINVNNDIECSLDYIIRHSNMTGIHVILSTTEIPNSIIKPLSEAVIPAKIALAMTSKSDSKKLLGISGAENLRYPGDMLYISNTSKIAKHIQAAFISDTETNNTLNFIKENYVENIEQQIMQENNTILHADSNNIEDSLLQEAIELAIECGKISTSLIQRRLDVGYSRAGRIIDQMEARGIISAANGSKPRDVLISNIDIKNTSSAPSFKQKMISIIKRIFIYDND